MRTAALEELTADFDMSLIHRPFMHRTDNSILQILETVTLPSSKNLDAVCFNPGSDCVIEKDGLVFINQILFTPDSETEKSLNPEFKKLVDSVIHR